MILNQSETILKNYQCLILKILFHQLSFQTEKQQANFKVLEKVFILLFSLNWLLVTVTNYLFETNGQFIAPAVVLNLFAFSFIVNALLFVSVSAIFGRSILKIWYSLKMIPQLQRNNRILWVHSLLVALYSFFYITAAVIVLLAIYSSLNVNKLLVAFNI